MVRTEIHKDIYLQDLVHWSVSTLKTFFVSGGIRLKRTRYSSWKEFSNTSSHVTTEQHCLLQISSQFGSNFIFLYPYVILISCYQKIRDMHQNRDKKKKNGRRPIELPSSCVCLPVWLACSLKFVVCYQFLSCIYFLDWKCLLRRGEVLGERCFLVSRFLYHFFFFLLIWFAAIFEVFLWIRSLF